MFNQSKIGFLRFFSFFFVVLLTVLFGSYFSYVTSKDTIRLEVSKATEQTVDQVMERLDFEFDQINRLLGQLNYNPQIRKMIQSINQPFDVAEIDPDDWADITAQLDTYRSNNRYLKSIRILSVEAMERVATNKASSNNFGLASNNSGYGLSFDEHNLVIIQQLKTIKQDLWIPTLINGWLKRKDISSASIQDYSGPEITFIRPYQNVRSKAGEHFVLVAEIKISIYKSILDDIQFGENGTFDVTSAEGTIIYSKNQNQLTQKAVRPDWFKHELTTQFGLDANTGIEQMVIRRTSKVNGWTLTTFTPTDSLFKSVNNTLYANLFVIFLLVIIFGLTFFMFRRFRRMNEDLERSGEKLREQNHQLEIQSKELMQLNEMKDQILSNTSHELRTPLNGIIGIAETLIDGVNGVMPEGARKNLQMIVASGRRLTNLVNDILDFAKLKNQKLELRQRPVSLRSAVDTCTALLMPIYAGKGLDIFVEVPPNLPPIYADDNRLQQVLHNLLSNALKFTEKGFVKIRASLQKEWISVEIEDSGIGIPADKIDQLFRAFEQVDGSISRKFGGTGLGLSICKQLVEMHGGNIEVRSTIGKGSNFIFTMPVSNQSKPPEAIRESASPVRSIAYEQFTATLTNELKNQNDDETNEQVLTNTEQDSIRYKILVVDDEPINLVVIKNHLNGHPYKITTAADGKEALNMMDRGYMPDLILLDVMMPEISGYEVVRRLRWKHSIHKLPILLLTAKTQTEDLLSAFEVGANDYMTKPINKFELLARISTHLQLADWNRMMQYSVDQRTRSIKALLDHSDQGFLTINPELIIQPEHSKECTTIFGRNIESVSFPALLYPDSPADAKSLDSVMKTILEDRNGQNIQLMMGLLPQELKIRERFVKFIYKLMPPLAGKEQQMMIVVNDVTESKMLSGQVEEEHKRLQMIVQTVLHDRIITSLIHSFDEYAGAEWVAPKSLDQLETWCIDALRTVHTYKGNFMQFGYHQTGEHLHLLEDKLSEWIERPERNLEEFTRFIQSHPLKDCINNDLDTLFELFGFNPRKSSVQVRVERDLIQEVETLVQMTVQSELKLPILNAVKKMYFVPVHELVDRFENYTMELAAQREKAIPDFRIDRQQIMINPDVFSAFRESLVHMFRNIVEHGLESTEERLLSGKPANPVVRIRYGTLSDTSFFLEIEDDGRGIDTKKIRRKLMLEQQMEREEITALSDDQIQQLIFNGQISTAEQINEYAGRGVGLSAVRIEAEKISGSISVQSKKGIGTCFRMEFNDAELIRGNEVAAHA